MLLNTTAQDNEHELSLPAAKGKDHMRNVESQKFNQTWSFKDERTATQDKDAANPPQILL